MKTLHNLSVAALLGIGAMALASNSASARIVCNEDGDCWHARQHYEYRPGFKLVIHPDNWRWGDHDRYRWREHRGRGYWQGGHWVEF